MRKNTIIGADGPTSVFLIKKNAKLTLRQKLEKCRYKLKRAYVERTIKANSHTLDEVIDYIVNVHGFVEVEGEEVHTEYEEMRRSHKIFKDVHRYYGVAREDIEMKSKRYEQVVRALIR